MRIYNALCRVSDNCGTRNFEFSFNSIISVLKRRKKYFWTKRSSYRPKFVFASSFASRSEITSAHACSKMTFSVLKLTKKSTFGRKLSLSYRPTFVFTSSLKSEILSAHACQKWLFSFFVIRTFTFRLYLFILCYYSLLCVWKYHFFCRIIIWKQDEISVEKLEIEFFLPKCPFSIMRAPIYGNFIDWNNRKHRTLLESIDSALTVHRNGSNALTLHSYVKMSDGHKLLFTAFSMTTTCGCF